MTSSRKIIAIGDLHGDYYRFLRILKEEKLIVINENNVLWNPDAGNTDLILIGDYCDWRGEDLEGPKEEWPNGTKNLLETVRSLFEQYEKLKENGATTINFYPLTGNHDLMMLDAAQIFKTIDEEKLKNIAETEVTPFRINSLLREDRQGGVFHDYSVDFSNWYYQGGAETILSFGGIINWRENMRNWLADFIENKTKFYLLLNNTLFTHSIPDHPNYWIPPEELDKIKDKEKLSEIRFEFVWGRKIWGYDVMTGPKTAEMTESEIDEILKAFKVSRIVIGHTPLMSEKPYVAYNGKLINIDSHGIQGSSPFKELYNEKIIPARLSISNLPSNSNIV